MKYIAGCIIGLLIGSFITSIVLGRAFGMSGQMTYEINMSNEFKYIEIIDSRGVEAFRNMLANHLGCIKPVYEELLDSTFWQRTRYSDDLLEKLAPYSQSAKCGEVAE